MCSAQPLAGTLEDFELPEFLASAATTVQDMTAAAERQGDRALAVAAFAAAESLFELLDVLVARQRRQAA